MVEVGLAQQAFSTMGFSMRDMHQSPISLRSQEAFQLSAPSAAPLTNEVNSFGEARRNATSFMQAGF